MIDPDLLSILACPVCKEKLTLKEDRLTCAECGRAYPLRDGIPILLTEEAEVGKKEEN